MTGEVREPIAGASEEFNGTFEELLDHLQALSPEQQEIAVNRIQSRVRSIVMLEIMRDYVRELFHESVDGADSDTLSFVGEQIARLQSGEEPIDAIYAHNNGSHVLDQDYLPAALAIAMSSLDDIEELDDIPRTINSTCKTLMWQPPRGNNPLPRKTPPAEILAGDYGPEVASSFALGALATLESIIDKSV